MIHVTFRFYAQLNGFLPFRFRHGRFRHAIAAPTSLQDAIESLGVPHAEIDVVLVNGTAEHFAYRLADGDDVAVYPAFRSIDLAGVLRAGPAGSIPPR